MKKYFNFHIPDVIYFYPVMFFFALYCHAQKVIDTTQVRTDAIIGGKLTELEFAVIYKTFSSKEFILERYSTSAAVLWQTRFTVDEKPDYRPTMRKLEKVGDYLVIILDYVIKNKKRTYLLYAYFFDIKNGKLLEKRNLFTRDFDLDKTAMDIIKKVNFSSSPDGKNIFVWLQKDYPSWMPGIEKKNIKAECDVAVWDENLNEVFNKSLVIDDNPYAGKEISVDAAVNDRGDVFVIRKEPPHKITVDYYKTDGSGGISLSDSFPDVNPKLLKRNSFLFRQPGIAFPDDHSLLFAAGTIPDNEYRVNSYCIYKFDFNEQRVAWFIRFDLTPEFINNVINPALTAQNNKPVKELKTAEIKDIIVNSDSSILVIAEQSDIRRGGYYSAPVMMVGPTGAVGMHGGGGMGGSKTMYKSGNILILSFDGKGNSVWQNIIAKKQLLSFPDAISHAGNIIDNELMIVSWCNLDNKDGYQPYLFRIDCKGGKLISIKKLYERGKQEDGLYNQLTFWLTDRRFVVGSKSKDPVFLDKCTTLTAIQF